MKFKWFSCRVVSSSEFIATVIVIPGHNHDKLK